MPGLSTDLGEGARFGLASATFQHVILSEICTQQSSAPAAGAQKVNAQTINTQKINAQTINTQKINAQKSCTTPTRRTRKGRASAS
jgi:hypothetical protein